MAPKELRNTADLSVGGVIAVSRVSGEQGGQMRIFVTIRPKANGEAANILLEIPDDVYEELQEIAEKRGLEIEEVIGEALRLEKLFAEATASPNTSLLYRVGRQTRELESV